MTLDGLLPGHVNDAGAARGELGLATVGHERHHAVQPSSHHGRQHPQHLCGSGPWSPLGFGSLLKNWWQVSISIPSLGTGIQGIGPLLHPTPITGALSPLLHSGLLSGSYGGGGNVGALASAGRAGTIGSLSVPQNWASAVPAVRTVAAEMNATALDAAPEMESIG